MNCAFLIFLSFFTINIQSLSSFPYISGDTFRSIANHIFDERHRNFNPSDVKSKDIIFVKSDYIESFFLNFHPLIPNSYILITHNSDASAPGNCQRFLDDPKLLVWFGQNMQNIDHPKLQPIPIGLANRYWEHGNIDVVQRSISQWMPSNPYQKLNSPLIYMNLTVNTNVTERKRVFNLFNKKPFCFNASRKNFEPYLQEMAQYCFVLSPEGNGIDCHRTWEALYMGCIPIVRSHSLNKLYEDLPVLIINDWKEITEEFLLDQFKKINNQQYNRDKLYAQYWFNKIYEYQQH